MPFHVKNSETDGLARELARLRHTGLTEAVHFALVEALAAEKRRSSLPDIAVAFCRELRALRPADR